MQTMTLTPDQIERWKLQASALAERYRSDAALRSRIDSGDMEDALSALGLVLPPGVEARIVVNTADTFHVVMPPDPNSELSDEMLTAVAGGKSAGSGCATAAPHGCNSIASGGSPAGGAAAS